MRDDLRAVLQEISGMPILQGDSYAPRHLEDASPVKRAGMVTGKSSGTETSCRLRRRLHYTDFFTGLTGNRNRTREEKRGDFAF
jgi:hypothetical protein